MSTFVVLLSLHNSVGPPLWPIKNGMQWPGANSGAPSDHFRENRKFGFSRKENL